MVFIVAAARNCRSESIFVGFQIVFLIFPNPALFFPSSLLYRAFETQMTRMEADFVQREAPPSYGQLIAQGLIPPVEDFPVYNPTQVTNSHTLTDTGDAAFRQK